MTANESNDDTADKSRATRRAFLGAAAAAAGLSSGIGTSTATSNHSNIDIEYGDYGTVRGSLPDRLGLKSHLNVYERGDENATVSVTGWRYDDKDPGIGLDISMDHAHLSMHIDPEEARTIARDLEAAADHAEGNHGDD